MTNDRSECPRLNDWHSSEETHPNIQIFVSLDLLRLTNFYGGFGTFVEFDPKMLLGNIVGGVGARASAIYYSLIETAKANGLEPYAYLCKVIRQIPYAETVEDMEALLPWNIK